MGISLSGGDAFTYNRFTSLEEAYLSLYEEKEEDEYEEKEGDDEDDEEDESDEEDDEKEEKSDKKFPSFLKKSKEEKVEEDYHPIYGRGGELRRTQTSLQVLGKHATQKDKSSLHNIPKGGTSISDRDPLGKRLRTGEYDRGSGNAAKRRAKGITKPKPKYFPNRLMRKDGQGIHDSYDYSDVIIDYLMNEGFVNNEVSAEVMCKFMSEEWREEILKSVS